MVDLIVVVCTNELYTRLSSLAYLGFLVDQSESACVDAIARQTSDTGLHVIDTSTPPAAMGCQIIGSLVSPVVRMVVFLSMCTCTVSLWCGSRQCNGIYIFLSFLRRKCNFR